MYDVWEPRSLSDRTDSDWSYRWLFAFGLLKPGITVERAQAEMDVVARQLARTYPATYEGWGVQVLPLQEAIFGRSREYLYPLFAAVGFVLLIACTNIANLLLSRASARHKEIGIRVAIGASRLRIVRQVLTESVLLAWIGGLLGLVLSVWGARLFVSLAPKRFPQNGAADLDVRVLAFNLAISLLTGIIFGLAPALRVSKVDTNESLKAGGRSSRTGSRHRTRSILVVAEVALALVLLVSAGLMLNTLYRTLHTDPGFNPQNLLSLEVRMNGRKYIDWSHPAEGHVSRVWRRSS